MTSSPLLSASNVCKSVAGTPLLEDVNLTVNAGEITVLMGPNGSGKSVLLSSLSGGLTLDQGDVTLMGKPVQDQRDALNVLLQDRMAIGHLTGRENATFYTRLHSRATGRWSGIARLLGLSRHLDKLVRHFSGGMQKKLELAITLDADVPVYLLDEPTAGLDLTVIGTVHDLLLDLQARDTGLLVSSHIPLDMEVADTVMFLRNGHVPTTGTPSDLLGDLPDVVRIRGSVGNLQGEVPDALIGDRLFTRGDEVRGFLDPESSPTQVEQFVATLPGQFSVTTERPSYVDLFNFQTKLNPPTSPNPCHPH